MKAPTDSSRTPESTPTLQTLRLRIDEMDCPTEEAMLGKAIAQCQGVENLRFDLVNRVLTVEHYGCDESAVKAAIRSVGMTPVPVAGREDTQKGSTTGMVRSTAPHSKRWWPLVSAAAIAVAAEASEWMEVGEPWLAAVLAVTAIAMVGLPTWKKGIVAIRHRTLNMNALMSVAVTGALLIGQWAEAAMVLVLFTLAERIEARSIARAHGAIQSLMQLAPERARVLDESGAYEERAAEEVPVDSIVRVRPGERVPLDGEIVEGTPALDESPITGESMPRDKTRGEMVFAGSINLHGEFDFRTTHRSDASTLARIIHAVEEAQSHRAPTQRLVDRFAAVYTPVVFALAVATALLWPFLAPGASFPTDAAGGIYRALVLLVIACPCALVISTPVTVVSGLAAAARSGILVKGGAFLEQGSSLRWIAFDKTGTLTEGAPLVREWHYADPAATPDERVRIRTVGAAIAERSNHPVSRAVFAVTRRTDPEYEPIGEVTSFRELPGHGSAGVMDDKEVWLGNRRLLSDRVAGDRVGTNCGPGTLDEKISTLEQQGMSVVVLGEERTPLALFAVRDPVKPTSASAISELTALGIESALLSGDNRQSVAAVARETGISEALGELLPEEKLAIIHRRCAEGPVGMVGDGINDAPALARADIGFAMGAAGSDASIETADVALMDDDLRKIPHFIRLSRAVRVVLLENITFAIGLKLLFLVLALSGHATLWMAVFADMGASLIVVANGLRKFR